MRARLALACLAASLCAAFGALAEFGAGAGAKAKSAGQKRPNVVVIESDDQTVESMRVMSKTRSLLGDHGVTFDNNLVSFPLCCPSRASFLTGQYSDNNGVRGNQAPTGGYSSLDHSNTLAVWLQKSGYYTSHIGKYLNGYGSGSVADSTIPPGWSDWQTSLDDSRRLHGRHLHDVRLYAQRERRDRPLWLDAGRGPAGHLPDRRLLGQGRAGDPQPCSAEASRSSSG